MAKNYSIQLDKAEDFYLLNPVIALNIVDFIMFNDTPKIITNFKLLEKEEFINYNDDIEHIFIELPKFKKGLKELQNLKDKFIYFIKNSENLTSENSSIYFSLIIQESLLKKSFASI